MRHLKLQVRRSESEILNVDVPPWEGPIVEYVHGGENVSVVGEIVFERDYPEVTSELDRLRTRYGVEPGASRSRVEEVYGIGLKGLEAAMEASRAEEFRATKSAKGTANSRKPKVEVEPELTEIDE